MTLRRPAGLGLRPAMLLPLLFAAALFACLPPAVKAQTAGPMHLARFRNTVNRKFSTISSGPQSTLILDMPAGATDADEKATTLRAAKAVWRSQSKSLSPQISVLRKRGVLKAGGVIPVSTLIGVRRNGVIVTPPAATRAMGTRSVGGGTLTFSYTGFDATDQALLQQVVSVAYPYIVDLYGQPSTSGNIEIVNAGASGDYTYLTDDAQRLAFGVYDVSHSQILLPVFDSSESTVEALILLMIHAFHGPAVFQYDAWEQGFARAATAIVARETSTTIGVTDPTQNGIIDLLPFYDLLNQPPLGNSTFFPPSQAGMVLDGQTTIGAMLLPRLGMSGAAWLKVYIENPNFFKLFNAAYYAQFDPTTNPGVAGNIPALTALAGTLLPGGVEGVPWTTWYQQQYILDTSASTGDQLYAFIVPGVFDATTGQSTAIDLIYYEGQSTGDETLLSGTAYATYFDWTDTNIFPGTASESASISTGEGFLNTLLFPDQTSGSSVGRITAVLHVGSATATAYIPSGFSGNFQGVILGSNTANSATVTEASVQPSLSTTSQTGTVTNSGFAVTLNGTSTTIASDLGVATVAVTNGTVTTNYRVNIGDGQYYAVFRNGSGGGGTIAASMSFATGDVPYLVSFPLTPFSPIIDQALGLDGSAFVLSYWNASKSTYETDIPGQSSITPLQMGRGYWLKFEPTASTTLQTVVLNGTAPSTDTDFVISCPYGWNLIGSPFAQPIDISTIEVQYQQNTQQFDDAVSSNLIAPQPFLWNQGTQSYSATSTVDGTTWQGYWIRVYVPDGVTLILPAPNSATSKSARAFRNVSRAATVGASRSAQLSADWTVRLQARQAVAGASSAKSGSRAVVANASFGVSRSVRSTAFSNLFDQEEPPAVTPSISVNFPHADWSAKGGTGRFVSDYRTDSGATTWAVNVDVPVSGSVTVSWDGLGTVPHRTNLTLVDTVSGTRTSLRSRSSYTFAGTVGKSRAFQIVQEAAKSLPLAINNLMSVPTRSAGVAGVGTRGVNIGYMLSGEADVTVQLSSLTGRVVRHLPATRAATYAQQTVFWDGRGDKGQSLPPGMYRMDIRATADDGTTAAQQRAIMLLQ